LKNNGKSWDCNILKLITDQLKKKHIRSGLVCNDDDNRVWTMKLKSLAIAVLLFTSAAPLLAVADHITPPDGRIPTDWLGPQPTNAFLAGVGDVVTDIALGTLYGASTSLHAEQGAQGTVVVVRDTECPVSQAYGARTADMAREYKDKGYNFIILYLNEMLGRTALASDASGFAGPATFIRKGGFDLAEKLRVASTGDVFVIDSSQRLRFRGAIDDQFGIGYTKPIASRHFLRNALDELISGKPVSVPSTTAPGCYIDADPTKEHGLQQWDPDIQTS